MEPNANEKNIQIQYSLEHNNISAFADKFMLDTILRNLISNAIKFTHNNGQVTIKATTSPNKQFVECTVSDKGIGMDNETLKNIFKLKTRKTSAGTNNEKGTGLGLILVHDFVLQNGGDIHVESQKGKGSSFIFTLPLAK
jgi:signal transduction histidine kinase